jgi:putative addiction module component (TIGR02574 family)
MTISSKELYEQFLALDERERADLASWILESLLPVEADAESAWAEEIKYRVDELESGEVTPVPWEEL